MCSEAYASQVPVLSVLPSSEAIGEFLRMTDSLTLLFLAGSAGADLFRLQAAGAASNRVGGDGRSSQASTKRGAVNKSLKR